MKTVLFLISTLLLSGCWFLKPDDLGVKNNSLKPCPSSPNCVSTYAKSDRHKINPIFYTKGEELLMKNLVSLVKRHERTNIVKQNENYLHVEFKSKIMRYIDDVEFFIDAENKTLHFRSASRIGYGDYGVNRDRMEKLRSLIEETEK